MAVLFTGCLVARQLLSPKLIERERERERERVRRHLEVFGRNKERASEETREGRERVCPRDPWKSFPAPILAAAVWSVKNFDRKRLTSHKQGVVHWYPRSKYTSKDQLGYLIIERWSNNTTVNTQLYIVFNKTNNRTESKIGIFKESMLCIRLS